MKKILCMMVILLAFGSLALFAGGQQDSGLIKVGIINNPPSESGYRAANVADFEKVFTEGNGYEVSSFYSLKNDEQLNAAAQFITDKVDYILLSAAATDGWDSILGNAKEAGIKVFLFDRMINAEPSLYEAAVVSDMAKQGTTAVSWLKSQGLDDVNVVHIQGAMGSDGTNHVTFALLEILNEGSNELPAFFTNERVDFSKNLGTCSLFVNYESKYRGNDY